MEEIKRYELEAALVFCLNCLVYVRVRKKERRREN